MRAVPDGDPVPSPAAEAVAAIRHELRSLLGEADAVGPLPTPAFVAPGDERSDLRGRHTTDLMPGAHWRTGWHPTGTGTGEEVTVIAALEDVGSDVPSVFVRGLSYMFGDVDIMPVENARRMGRALLAAADLAGSPLIAKKCSRERDER